MPFLSCLQKPARGPVQNVDVTLTPKKLDSAIALDSSLTSEELDAVRASFAAADTKNTGKISLDGFSKVLDATLGEASSFDGFKTGMLPDLRIEWLLSAYDNDGKGGLDLTECQRAVAHVKTGTGVTNELTFLWKQIERLQAGGGAQLPASQAASHASHASHAIPLPPVLEDFTPLAKLPSVKSAVAALPPLESAVLAAPNDAAARAALAASLSEVQAAYAAAIAERLGEAGIVPTCDAVIAAGNRDCAVVYSGSFGMIASSEAEGMAAYAAAVGEVRQQMASHGVPCLQAHRTVVDLYSEAASVHRPFGELMGRVHERVPSQLTFDATAIKRSSRIVEKTLLREDEPGNCDRVCDLVRAMFVVASMAEVAALVRVFHALAAEGRIQVVRVKDRFREAPSAGGWRDVMINLVLCAEGVAKHVCEVQIAHAIMLNARKGLPGHVIYGRVRNASEILEKLGVGPVPGETRLEAVWASMRTDASAARCHALARQGVMVPPLLGGVDFMAKPNQLIPTKPLAATPLTFECWMRASSALTHRVGILCGGFNKGTCINWEIHDGGMPRLFWRSGEEDWKVDECDVRDGQWKHLAFVVSSSQTSVTFYVDGVAFATRYGSFKDCVPEVPPKIGDDYRKGTSPGVPLRASLKMLRLWSTSRTPAQLRAAANAHPSADADGLLLAYYFDEGDSDSRVVDHSPHANHAAFVAPAAWIDRTIDDKVGIPPPPMLCGVDFKRDPNQLTPGAPVSATPLTFECWLRALPGTKARIGVLAGGHGSPTHVNWEVHDEGKPRIYWDGKVDWKVDGIDVRNGMWIHLAFVVADDLRSVTCFVNSHAVATKEAKFEALVPSKPIRIGDDYRKGTSPGMPLRASLKMLRVWSTSRTPAQLRAAANAHPADASGLMMCYYFNYDDTDGRVVDHSPCANHATPHHPLTFLQEGEREE